MPKNSSEDLVKLSHSPLENHLKTEQAKAPTPEKTSLPTTTRELREFVWRNFFGFIYHYIKSRFGPRHPYQAYPRNGDDGIYQLTPSGLEGTPVCLGLLSDWASDTVESDAVGSLVRGHAPDYSIHLGDVYFVGTPQEVADNFTVPHASWYYGASGSLALSGNHEMYSNGSAFFKNLLPAMRVRKGADMVTQQAGFFCLENKYWRIIGLDTGYTSVGRPGLEYFFPPDSHLRPEQVDWLTQIVKLGDPADKRGLVFLSHHPYFSAFRHNFVRPAQQLREILGAADRPLVWLWGHEHRLTIYDRTRVEEGPEVWGRGIGHGGMPVELGEPRYAEKYLLRYYDRRIRTRIGRIAVGHNGFALLTLEGPVLKTEYRDDRDTIVLEERWTLNPVTGELTREELSQETLLARYQKP